jgi:carboxyl-terminal processing protease
MRTFLRASKYVVLFGAFGISSWLALRMRGDGLWNGLQTANAANTKAAEPYDLKQVKVAHEVLKTIKDRYVDPKRVRPREMLLSALDFVQRDVAQVIVTHEENAPTVKVRVDTQEREFRVDNVLGPWDVEARLREIFAFVQDGLRGTEVDLREVEYAACNGMLHTLDPHSVLLSPDAYKEMSTSTSGQFGGLGIVISIRDGQLTVMNPMPGTPAGRAGIKKYDRITMIDNESTLNMGLSEAVNHLRGVPGTKVKIMIHRDGDGGWQGSKPFELVREVIKVQSVEHKLLDGNVGYVRLKQFTATTTSDMEAALADMKRGGDLKGLVLDLRGNPGGLLDQAAKVVDKFVEKGPIVATVGNPSEGREEKTAKVEGTEPNYPIVLLVSGNSASASEIVAGALKNHDRAVIVGETTFGKGSVQLIFSEFPDKAALKLTIAQYLTEPGDISIQGTGVTPDIELDPMTADTQEMDLSVDTGGIRERDLSRSLQNARIREGQKPLETVRYSLTSKERQDLRERGGDPDDGVALDFPIRFARDLASKIPMGTRSDQLRAAKPIVEKVRAEEVAKVGAELGKLGIDWADAPADAAATPVPVEVKLETDAANNEVGAGEPLVLKATITNKGAVPLFRVSGVTKSDNAYFENKELVIGKLEPGKSKTVSIPLGYCETQGYKAGSSQPLPKDAPRVCHLPKDMVSRADWLSVAFDEAKGRIKGDSRVQITVKGQDRPQFAYTYQLAEEKKGNGDGKPQPGETFAMYLVVKNVGKGKATAGQASVRNLSGDGLLLHEGRFDVVLNPGESKKLKFTFDINKPPAGDDEVKLELTLADRDLRETVVEKVRMPISAPIVVASGGGSKKAGAAGATLLEAPEAGARSFARLPSGTAATVLGTAGEFTKLALGDGRFAFAKSAELEAGGAPTPTVAFDDVFGHSPPSIEIAAPPLAVRDGHFLLKGSAEDTARILDGYIFVGSKKVFYQSNRNGTNPKKMDFSADLPLRPGINVITVIARETPDTIGRKVFVVRRDAPDGMPMATPKNEEDLGETGGDDD